MEARLPPQVRLVSTTGGMELRYIPSMIRLMRGSSALPVQYVLP